MSFMKREKVNNFIRLGFQTAGDYWVPNLSFAKSKINVYIVLYNFLDWTKIKRPEFYSVLVVISFLICKLRMLMVSKLFIL